MCRGTNSKRAIVTSTGESVENGPTNFYALNQSPEDMTENVSQAFLGLTGAKLAQPPAHEKWTNDQYYGMASMFGAASRPRAKVARGAGETGCVTLFMWPSRASWSSRERESLSRRSRCSTGIARLSTIPPIVV